MALFSLPGLPLLFEIIALLILLVIGLIIIVVIVKAILFFSTRNHNSHRCLGAYRKLALGWSSLF